MAYFILAISSFLLFNSVANSDSWTSQFDAKARKFAIPGETNFPVVSVEVKDNGKLIVSRGDSAQALFENSEVVRFASLMNKHFFVVVAEISDGAHFSYKWAAFSRSKESWEFSDTFYGNIVLRTDKLRPITASIGGDTLTVDFLDELPADGNRSTLLLQFNNRCLAKGTIGTLERYYLLREEIDKRLESIEKAPAKDWGLVK